MGGLGSGDWYRFDKKATVEDCWGLDVNRLARGGRLRPMHAGTVTWSNTRTGADCASVGFVVTTGRDGALVLNLQYRLNADDEIALPIRLQTTRPNYGGSRLWFTCPLVVRGVACQRRVGKLYLRGRYFGCRHCHNLTYESCQEAHRFDGVLGELGADFGLGGGEVSRLLGARKQTIPGARRP